MAVWLGAGGIRNSQAQGAPSAAAADAAGELSAQIDALRKSFDLESMWFRREEPGAGALEVAAGNAKPGELLPIASLSKSMTGIAIALLIQQGRIGLDSRLDAVLGPYYQSRGRALDPSMAAITVERLLSHRAGLPTNFSSDPAHGLDTGAAVHAGGGNRDFFEFVKFHDSDRSDGSSAFRYSNVSYLMLGMVVEAASSERYADFCQRNIFGPLGVTDASIPSGWRLVSPFAGWWMTLADVLRVWTAFDLSHPSAVLQAQTLQTTLLARLGSATESAGRGFYTLGANVRQDTASGAYVVNHNGIADFVSGERYLYLFAEKYVPGRAWVIAMSPYGQRRIDGPMRNAVNQRVRQILSGGGVNAISTK